MTETAVFDEDDGEDAASNASTSTGSPLFIPFTAFPEPLPLPSPLPLLAANPPAPPALLRRLNIRKNRIPTCEGELYLVIEAFLSGVMVYGSPCGTSAQTKDTQISFCPKDSGRRGTHIFPHLPEQRLRRVLQNVQQGSQHFSSLGISRAHCVQLTNLCRA